jgi:hypothetical protein
MPNASSSQIDAAEFFANGAAKEDFRGVICGRRFRGKFVVIESEFVEDLDGACGQFMGFGVCFQALAALDEKAIDAAFGEAQRGHHA